MVDMNDLKIGDLCLVKQYGVFNYRIERVTRINKRSVTLGYCINVKDTEFEDLYKLNEEEIELFRNMQIFTATIERISSLREKYRDMFYYVKKLKEISEECKDDVNINWSSVQEKVDKLAEIFDPEIFEIEICNQKINMLLDNELGY